jgi:hypothetical protein
MSQGTSPPRLARAILQACAGLEALRDPIIGDLEEEFASIAARFGAVAARRWYWSQLFGSLVPLLWLRTRYFLDLRSTRAVALGGVTLLLGMTVCISASVALVGAVPIPSALRSLMYLLAVFIPAACAGFVTAAIATRSGVPVLITTGLAVLIIATMFVASPEPEHIGAWLVWLPGVSAAAMTGAALRRARAVGACTG